MLTKRQLLVLKEIIRLFTESGQPVGSKTLMQELPVHVSSATIRNDMAALEDAGLITKTHSSSGRVPSTALQQNGRNCGTKRADSIKSDELHCH